MACIAIQQQNYDQIVKHFI